MIMELNNKIIEIPVIFYDGEREIDLGKVEIIPSMTFKFLQFTLSNKIGISPNQITIYIDFNSADNNNHRYNHRRRRPVTSKFDFSAVKLGECFFWVVLKRSRCSRRRRNNVVDNVYLEYVNRVRMILNLEREKERYLMSLNLNSNVYDELSYSDYSVNQSNYEDDYYERSVLSRSSGDEFDVCSSSSERVFCDVCCNSPASAADTVPFHCCKNDVVTTGFRSLVGPIAPPPKNRPLC